MEEGEVEGEGDAVFVLAGDAVVEEEEVLVELGHALHAIAIEEVVEEHGVISRQVHMADPSHLVQRRQETWSSGSRIRRVDPRAERRTTQEGRSWGGLTLVEEVDAVVSEECFELHLPSPPSPPPMAPLSFPDDDGFRSEISPLLALKFSRLARRTQDERFGPLTVNSSRH